MCKGPGAAACLVYPRPMKELVWKQSEPELGEVAGEVGKSREGGWSGGGLVWMM